MNAWDTAADPAAQAPMGPRAHLAMEERGPKEVSPFISSFAPASINRSWA